MATQRPVMPMFPAGDDLPLFSGTPIAALPEVSGGQARDEPPAEKFAGGSLPLLEAIEQATAAQASGTSRKRGGSGYRRSGRTRRRRAS